MITIGWGIEGVRSEAHRPRHLPLRKRFPDQAAAGFFRCFHNRQLYIVVPMPAELDTQNLTLHRASVHKTRHWRRRYARVLEPHADFRQTVPTGGSIERILR